jgi:hypothetical protein
MKCDWCKEEMSGPTPADSCKGNSIVEFPTGEELAAIPYDPDCASPTDRCHDCNIAQHGLHHPGCDTECCPKCGGQLIGCGCLDEDS